MQAFATWKGRREFLLEDGHAHSLTVDFPLAEGGRSAGPPPMELSLLSLAGSIASAFAAVAERHRIVCYGVTVALEADPPHGTATISQVRGTLRVRTRSDLADVTRALRIAEKANAVEAIFEKAGIPVHIVPIVMSMGPAGAVAAERSETGPG